MCHLCDVGTFSPTIGSQLCSICLYPYTSNEETGSASCVCAPGFYSVYDPDGLAEGRTPEEIALLPNREWRCVPCPDGAACLARGTKFEDVGTLPGYWRADESRLFFKCPRPHDCAGKLDGGVGLCAEHHNGILCAGCAEGYYMTNSECVACDSTQDIQRTKLAFIHLAAFFVLILIALFVLDDRAYVKVLTEDMYTRLLAYHLRQVESAYAHPGQPQFFEVPSFQELAKEHGYAVPLASFGSEISPTNQGALAQTSVRTADERAQSDLLHGVVRIEPPRFKWLGVSTTKSYLFDNSKHTKTTTSSMGEPISHTQSKAKTSLSTLATPIRIFIFWTQCMSLLFSLIGVSWPRELMHLSRFIHAVDFRIYEWAAVACISGHLNHLHMLAFTFGIALVAAVLLVLVHQMAFKVLFTEPDRASESGWLIGRMTNALLTGVSEIHQSLLNKFQTRGNAQDDPSAHAHTIRARFAAIEACRNEFVTMLQHEVYRAQMMKILTFIWYLFFPRILRLAMATFYCKEIDGTDYVQTDFSTVCGSEGWRDSVIISAFALGVFILPIPLTIYKLYSQGVTMAPGFGARLLVSVRSNVSHQIALGFLIDGYDSDNWLVALACDTLMKIILAVVVPALPASYQIPIALCTIWIFITLTLLLAPIVRSVDDSIALFMCFRSFLIFPCRIHVSIRPG